MQSPHVIERSYSGRAQRRRECRSRRLVSWCLQRTQSTGVCHLLVVTHDWVIPAWTVGRCAVCSWNTVAAFGVDIDRWQGVRAGPRWGAEQTVFLDPRLWASSSASSHPFLHLKTRLEIDDLVSFL